MVHYSLPVYQLVNTNKILVEKKDFKYLENIKRIIYGETYEDLVKIIKSLKSVDPFENSINLSLSKDQVREKYLKYLIKEYNFMNIFDRNQKALNVTLESTFIEFRLES